MITHIITYELLTVDVNQQHIREKQHIACCSEDEANVAIDKLLEMNEAARERFSKSSVYKRFNQQDKKVSVDELAGLWLTYNAIKKYVVTDVTRQSSDIHSIETAE